MKVAKYIEELNPYKPGKPIEETKRQYGLTSVVKLASNESPVGISNKVKSALAEAISDLNRYPDPSCFQLKKRVSQYLEVAEESITFGNGSNELIDLLIRTFCVPGDTVLTVQCAFIAFKVCSQAAGVKVVEIPLTADLKIDVEALIEAVKKHRPKILYVPNPNNPTGTYLSASEFKYLMDELKDYKETLILFDEAYNEFVRAADYPQVLKQMNQAPQLAVIKTFSKVFGLAGLRLGTLIAAPEIINYINKVRNPFNVNTLAQVATQAVLDDPEYIKKAQEVNWQGLDYFYKELSRLNLKYWESQTNFVLFDTGKDSEVVFEALLKKGVILRPVKGYGLMTHLRMSVGLPEENKQAIEALEAVLKSF